MSWPFTQPTMGCCASKPHTSAYARLDTLATVFARLDDALVAAVAAGHLAFLDASQLRCGKVAALTRRQDLPSSAFLTPATAVTARSGHNVDAAVREDPPAWGVVGGGRFELRQLGARTRVRRRPHSGVL